jgi:hypothetical protein
MDVAFLFSCIIMCIASIYMFSVKPISRVYRVVNKNQKINENDCYNVVKVDIDGIIVDLAFTDSQIMVASERMAKNMEDIV